MPESNVYVDFMQLCWRTLAVGTTTPNEPNVLISAGKPLIYRVASRNGSPNLQQPNSLLLLLLATTIKIAPAASPACFRSCRNHATGAIHIDIYGTEFLLESLRSLCDRTDLQNILPG